MVMDGAIQILITIPFSEKLILSLKEISPRLKVKTVKAVQAADIPPEVWNTAQVLYTNTILPQPDQSPELDWIQFHWAGVNHVLDSQILHKPGLKATTLSGAGSTKLAEYAVMMLLALGQRLPQMFEHQLRTEWPKDRWERFSPLELRDSTVGIVGYGSIGRQIANLLRPFGANVLATKRDARNPSDSGYMLDGFGDPEGDLLQRLYPAEALHSMLRECDFVVICVPLTSRTKLLFNAETFSVMKPGSYLINISRGGVVDDSALVESINNHQLAGAALDVFENEPLAPDHPLWKLPGVIITPHISGSSPHYDQRAVDLFSENLKRYLEGKPLLNIFDLDREY